MLVYVLEFMEYDNFQIIGIFTSMEKAESAKEKFMAENKKYDDENFEITSHEVQ